MTDQKPQEPFFVRYLENQELPVETDVKAGAKTPPYEMTQKWPSDGDEQAAGS